MIVLAPAVGLTVYLGVALVRAREFVSRLPTGSAAAWVAVGLLAYPFLGMVLLPGQAAGGQFLRATFALVTVALTGLLAGGVAIVWGTRVAGLVSFGGAGLVAGVTVAGVLESLLLSWLVAISLSWVGLGAAAGRLDARLGLGIVTGLVVAWLSLSLPVTEEATAFVGFAALLVLSPVFSACYVLGLRVATLPAARYRTG